MSTLVGQRGIKHDDAAPLDPAATIAVGDTPRDVTAGHGAGIKVVGVATGSYSVEEQRQVGHVARHRPLHRKRRPKVEPTTPASIQEVTV